MKRSYTYVGLTVVAAAAAAWILRPQTVDDSAGRTMVEVTVPDLTPSERQGAAAFEASCAQCHGDNAAGIQESGPPLVHVIYEPNHHGDAAFYVAAMNGVRQHHWPFGDMPPIAGVSESEIASIVAYVRRLQQANGIY